MVTWLLVNHGIGLVWFGLVMVSLFLVIVRPLNHTIITIVNHSYFWLN